MKPRSREELAKRIKGSHLYEPKDPIPQEDWENEKLDKMTALEYIEHRNAIAREIRKKKVISLIILLIIILVICFFYLSTYIL